MNNHLSKLGSCFFLFHSTMCYKVVENFTYKAIYSRVVTFQWFCNFKELGAQTHTSWGNSPAPGMNDSVDTVMLNYIIPKLHCS